MYAGQISCMRFSSVSQFLIALSRVLQNQTREGGEGEGERGDLTFLVTMKDTVPPWSMMAFLSPIFFLNGRDESRSRDNWHLEKMPIAACRRLRSGSLSKMQVAKYRVHFEGTL